MEQMMITIPIERYEELIKNEAKMQFLLDYVKREVVTTADVLYYLGGDEDGNE